MIHYENVLQSQYRTIFNFEILYDFRYLYDITHLIVMLQYYQHGGKCFNVNRNCWLNGGNISRFPSANKASFDEVHGKLSLASIRITDVLFFTPLVVRVVNICNQYWQDLFPLGILNYEVNKRKMPLHFDFTHRFMESLF